MTKPQLTWVLAATNLITITLLVWGYTTWRGGPVNGNGSATLVTPVTPPPLLGCPGNCYPAVCDTLHPFNLTLATQMIDSYREHHWKKINAGCFSDPNTCDARSVWFSLDTLKRFINGIETKTCALNCPTHLSLGIRIYYAEYPGANQMTAWGLDASLAGMHTVLMVPTYDVAGIPNDHMDFNPNLLTNCAGNSVFDTTVAMVPMLTPQPTMQNHGGLAPPPYDCNAYWHQTGAAFMMYVDHAHGYYGTDPIQGAPNGTPVCPPSR